jgi:type II secretory pathway component PulK
MDKPMRYPGIEAKNEQGTAIIAPLMFLMAMGVLSTALIFTVQNEMKASAAYKYGQQAMNVATPAYRIAFSGFRTAIHPGFRPRAMT